MALVAVSVRRARGFPGPAGGVRGAPPLLDRQGRSGSPRDGRADRRRLSVPDCVVRRAELEGGQDVLGELSSAPARADAAGRLRLFGGKEFSRCGLSLQRFPQRGESERDDDDQRARLPLSGPLPRLYELRRRDRGVRPRHHAVPQHLRHRAGRCPAGARALLRQAARSRFRRHFEIASAAVAPRRQGTCRGRKREAPVAGVADLAPLGERRSVAASEYTVWETIAPAAAATGLLLDRAYPPEPGAKERVPAADITQLPGYAPLP